MPRKLRIQYDGAWYHVMNRGINRSYIFSHKEGKQYFLSLLSKISEKYDVEIHAYCIMDNHYHLIIRTPLGNLDKAMHYLGYNYAKFINQKFQRIGPVFQSRYLPILMNCETYLLRGSRYIHRNPLEAKMLTDLVMYEWSSYVGYIDASKAPEWLHCDEVVGRFKKLDYQYSFKQFTEEVDDKDLSIFFNTLKYQAVLVNPNDIEKIFTGLSTQRMPNEYFDNKNVMKLYRPPDINIIIDVAANYFGITRQQLCNRKVTLKNRLARNVVIFLCKNLGKASLRSIARAMGGISPPAVSNNLARNSEKEEVKKFAKFIELLVMACRKISS